MAGGWGGAAAPPGPGGGMWDTAPAGPMGGDWQAMSPVLMELKRLFLELSPEDNRRYRASELVQHCSEGDAAACIPLVLDRLVNFPSTHGLGIHVLSELLRLHPMAVVRQFAPARIYDIFNPTVDEAPAGAFLHSFLRCKQAQGGSAEQESGKLQRLLMRRAKVQSLRRVPASTLRGWLCQIWLDVPSARPDRQLLGECCARWISDQNVPLMEKGPCLSIMRQELERRGRPDGETWLVSLLLEQVCRDPVSHSPDLQHLLWLLGGPLNPMVLGPLLGGLAEDRGRLVTLWVCVCLWVPQPALPDTPPLPAGAPPPLHSFLRAVLVAFSQLPAADELCRTCLLALAAAAAGGEGAVAAMASDLLLLLHRDGPILAGDVWLPLTPLLERIVSRGQSASAVELLRRLREVMGEAAPPPMYNTTGGMGGMGSMGGMDNYAMNGTTAPPSAMAPQPWGVLGGAASTALAAQTSFQTTPYPAPLPASGWGGDFKVGPQADGTVGVAFEPVRVGLQNIHETCYMNTLIQSLFMTNAFVKDLYGFKMKKKPKMSNVDLEDFETGKRLVKLLQRHMATMLLTHHPHTDIGELLKGFPSTYQGGTQQDVSEAVRYVFDKLGGSEQTLVRDCFAGELVENTQCQVCGGVKRRPETFTDLVLTVPPEDLVHQMQAIPTTQTLLNQRLQFEFLTDDNLLECDHCQRKTKAGKWCEITSPPSHLCICLNRFVYDVQKQDFSKQKTPVRVDGVLRIGPFVYDLYMVIVHQGKDASSGHYYAIGGRSEVGQGQKRTFVLMDDSQVKEADLSVLTGGVGNKPDDNPYVLFYRCQQAPPSPGVRLPQSLADEVVKAEAAKVIT